MKATRAEAAKRTSSAAKTGRPAQTAKAAPVVKRKASPPPTRDAIIPVRVTNHVPTSLDGVERSSALVFDAGRPFWQKLPGVALVFLKIAIAPIVLLKQALDILLAAVLLAVLLPLVLWLAGFIPNAVAVPFLEAVGTRGLEALRTLGLPL